MDDILGSVGGMRLSPDILLRACKSGVYLYPSLWPVMNGMHAYLQFLLHFSSQTTKSVKPYHNGWVITPIGRGGCTQICNSNLHTLYSV